MGEGITDISDQRPGSGSRELWGAVRESWNSRCRQDAGATQAL